MAGQAHDEGGEAACWAHVVDHESAAAVVADLSLTRDTGGTGGAVWSLPHDGDLDANLVRLAPDTAIAEHLNDEVDLLLVVREGDGELTVDGIRHRLTDSTVALVRRGARRSIRAGGHGLVSLTVHKARGPLTLKPTASSTSES
jgi:quercetin dioxygenase-like cupin family protein